VLVKLILNLGWQLILIILKASNEFTVDINF